MTTVHLSSSTETSGRPRLTIGSIARVIPGRNTGPRPMELLLMGMGGCTSFDILNILEKARAEVTDCVATIEAEQRKEP